MPSTSEPAQPLTSNSTRVDRPPRAPSGHLSNIQVLRGVAAVMVVIYHIGNEFSDRGVSNGIPDVGVGSAGVDIFFVVSGFIMAHSTAAVFGAPGAPVWFLARRAARLVPLYWLITSVFALLLVWQARHTGLSGETWRWLGASYAFLFYPHGDGGDFPLYAQGWTLNFEMFFYACFAAVLPLRRAVALWTLAVGLAGFTAVGFAVPLPWPADRWANTDILEFVFGLGLASLEASGLRLRLPAAIVLVTAGFAVFALTIGSVDDWLPLRGFVWGPPAAAVVAAAALYRPRRRGGTVRAALERLGDASYALYLVHYAVFVGLGDAVECFVPVSSLPPLFYGSLCFFGAIASALVVHRHVERPLTRGLNRAFGLGWRWRALTGAARTAE